MINYKHADLFKKDNVKKELVLDFGDFQIKNESLYLEAFELQESLCSQNELKFGCCEASVLKFKCRNEFGELKNKWFEASMILDGNASEPFRFGVYRVFSDEPSGDRKYKNITAYDPMYDILNAEMVEWYDSLSFPKPMFYFRNSFFAYLGIEQAPTELVNDYMLIEKTIEADSISGKEIITAICEINGVFGHINRQGLFEYVSLVQKQNIIHPGMKDVYPGSGIYPGMVVDNFELGLYPMAELYPSDDLFPAEDSIRNYIHENITNERYISCSYEDFETQTISKLQIRQEKNDIGSVYGTGENTYIVENNFLVYGKSASDLKQISRNLFAKIFGVYYRPFKANLQSNPCIEVGDVVVIHTKYKEVESYVFERTIKGIQSLKDTFESKGVYEYEEKVNSVNKEVKRLKGKTAVLEHTVEVLNSEINDEETGLKSQIKQTSENIEAKVSKGNVSSELSIELGKILLRGNRIAIESDYFTLTEEGKIKAVDGEFSGTVFSNNAIITGGNLDIESPSTATSVVRIYKGKNETIISPGDIDFYDSSSSAFFGPGEIVVNSNGETGGSVFLINRVNCTIGEKTTVKGDFYVIEGTKSRIAKTKSYNERLLYCYEMPSPIFGDVGHGVIGADGLCYVDIDQVFFETVDMNQSYQVFLQSYSEHNVYVSEKQAQYFVVKGKPNTEFDWELKAKQLDFPIHRLEEKFTEDDYEETDYITSAIEYLDEYEKEVLNYE